jgi:hypothetical protein
MSEPDALHQRGRAIEEAYFRRKDRELLEKFHQAAVARRTERELGAVTGIDDPSILHEMAELGFTPDTVVLLPLVPVLQVAWAEAGVSEIQQHLLVKLARARGIVEHSPADVQLAKWLTTRPDDAVFEGGTRLIRALLEAHPAGQLQVDPDDLVQHCEHVAKATDSLLGFLSMRLISPEEREILTHISAELKRR